MGEKCQYILHIRSDRRDTKPEAKLYCTLGPGCDFPAVRVLCQAAFIFSSVLQPHLNTNFMGIISFMRYIQDISIYVQVLYSILHRKSHFRKFVAEFCHFLGFHWTVIIPIQHLPQPLYCRQFAKGEEDYFSQKRHSS